MKQLKTKTIEFLSVLEGYHQCLKMLHWSATHHALHILTDDMDEEVLKVEDPITECIMNVLDSKFNKKNIKKKIKKKKI